MVQSEVNDVQLKSVCFTNCNEESELIIYIFINGHLYLMHTGFIS